MKKRSLDRKEMEKKLDSISVVKAKSVKGGTNLQSSKSPLNIAISISISF